MKKILSLLFLLAAGTAASAQNNALNAGVASQGYMNPVIPGYYPDPSVCRVGDDFYLVNSSFQYFPGVPVFHSRDLVHWEQIGNVLDRPSQVDLSRGGASSGIFAPTIRHHDGKFYMVTTNINAVGSGKGNFIVTAEDPAGPWNDPVFIDGVTGIDPSLFWEDGKMYLVWAMNGIGFAELDPETFQLKTDPVVIWEGDGDSSPEGPHLYKKDGYYYLLIAEGGTEMGHKVNIARSTNIRGPYASNPGNPILTQKRRVTSGNLLQGTGHADLVEAADGSWWMVFLGFRNSAGSIHHVLGRETCLAPVRWDRDAWPVVNGKGWVDTDMSRVATLPQSAMPQAPQHYDFIAGDRLGPEWIHINNPVASNYVYENNSLVLKATPVGIDDPRRTPTFVARRQTDVACQVTAVLNLLRAKAGDRAGLTVYMDAGGHYDLALGYADDGSRQIELSYRLGNLRHVEKTVRLRGAFQVFFRVDAEAAAYKFSYSTDGEHYTPLGEMDAKFLSSETRGGFTGVLFGLFSEGREGTRATALVSSFTYKPVLPAWEGWTNPLFEGRYADPEGIMIGEELWIYPTYSYPYKEQLHLDAFSSRDLKHWTKHENIITSDEITWLNQALWAPAIVGKDGKYYLFYACNDVHEGEIGGIGVAVADRPEGPFRDLLGKPLIGEIVNGAQPIDQFVFRDPASGQWLMYYGGWKHCNLVRLADDFRSLVPFEDGEIYKEVTPENYVEGPFMLVKDGKYYFMWSEGGWTRDDYCVAYAVADSPFGPFERVGTILKADNVHGTGAGHHSVVRRGDDYYIIYHRHPMDANRRDGNNRVVCIDRLEFAEDGSIIPVKMS